MDWLVITFLIILVFLTKQSQCAQGGIENFKPPKTVNKLITVPEMYCSQLKGDDRFIEVKSVSNLVKPYLRTCWNVDEVVDCIVQNRANRGYDAPPLSRWYPLANDLKRAYYIFCFAYFDYTEIAFTTSFDKVPDCDEVAIAKECANSTDDTSLTNTMDRAIAAKDNNLATILACNITVSSLLCKMNKYKACYTHWDKIFHLEFLKLGPKCLVSHQIESYITTNADCQKKPGGPSESPHTVPSVAVTIISIASSIMAWHRQMNVGHV